MNTVSPWIGYRITGNKVKFRVIAIHCAGSDASMYKELFLGMKDRQFLDLISVQLPGRSTRFKEPLETKYNKIVESLFSNLQVIVKDDIPTIFLGYSMGASLCFELALKFKEFNLKTNKLIVCARTAPSYKSIAVNRGTLTDEKLIKIVEDLGGTPTEILNNKSLMDYYLKILKSDFLMIDDYNRDSKNKVDCPIYAASGIYDKESALIGVEKWSEFTTKNFNLRLFDGKHFFIRSNYDLFLDYINNTIYS